MRYRRVVPSSFRVPIRALVPVALSATLLLLLLKPEARAVPSYSRQTGLSCGTCHFAPPELTAFGRQFKLEGYTFRTKSEISEDKKGHNSPLHLLESLPLSAVFDTSYTNTAASQPNTQNGSFQLPQDVSLFLAGAWGSHVGSFAQVTYTAQDDHFSWDNTDIRYANKDAKLLGKSFVYGVDFNNNPTVEDLWNSTPAWGYPFASTNVAPTPTAGAIINGALAQDVAGFGGYAMWNNHLYIDATLYSSDHIGGPQPNPGVGFAYNIRGVAPYWRVAWQTVTTNNDIEFGTYGMHMQSSPGAITGPTDSYTDWALDFQYNRTLPQLGGDVLSFRGSYVRENSDLAATFAAGGAAQAAHHLNTFQGNVEYHFGTMFSGTFGLFDTTGTSDPLLYPEAAIIGNANGDPRSNGYILNISWWPEQNIQFAAQYTGYLRFNGLATNYDAVGRNAGGNNSIFLLGRFVF